jgi:transcriptional regulator with XRE-family HTH domain
VNTLDEIGGKIATARKTLQLRQTDLASKAQVSRSTIDALENGRASDIGYSKLARILAVLGLELRLGPAASRRPTLDELLKERDGDDEDLDG